VLSEPSAGSTSCPATNASNANARAAGSSSFASQRCAHDRGGIVDQGGDQGIAGRLVVPGDPRLARVITVVGVTLGHGPARNTSFGERSRITGVRPPGRPGARTGGVRQILDSSANTIHALRRQASFTDARPLHPPSDRRLVAFGCPAGAATRCCIGRSGAQTETAATTGAAERPFGLRRWNCGDLREVNA
jgi:hypothetical protein